jgi:hypothetical protein
MVWAELTISNARKCQICAYYRPHPDDDISLEPSNCHLLYLKTVDVVFDLVFLGIHLKFPNPYDQG